MSEQEAPTTAESPQPPNNPTTAVPHLQSGEILIAEYAYIAKSAFQANEDRARVSTYYVVTFGTLYFALQILLYRRILSA